MKFKPGDVVVITHAGRREGVKNGDKALIVREDRFWKTIGGRGTVWKVELYKGGTSYFEENELELEEVYNSSLYKALRDDR